MPNEPSYVLNQMKFEAKEMSVNYGVELDLREHIGTRDNHLSLNEIILPGEVDKRLMKSHRELNE